MVTACCERVIQSNERVVPVSELTTPDIHDICILWSVSRYALVLRCGVPVYLKLHPYRIVTQVMTWELRSTWFNSHVMKDMTQSWHSCRWWWIEENRRQKSYQKVILFRMLGRYTKDTVAILPAGSINRDVCVFVSQWRPAIDSQSDKLYWQLVRPSVKFIWHFNICHEWFGNICYGNKYSDRRTLRDLDAVKYEVTTCFENVARNVKLTFQ